MNISVFFQFPDYTPNQWWRHNFSAAGAQPGHQNLDWGTFKKLRVPSLFLVEASSYTVRTNGSTHCRKIVFCEEWQSTIVENHLRKKTYINPLNLGNGCTENNLLA